MRHLLRRWEPGDVGPLAQASMRISVLILLCILRMATSSQAACAYNTCTTCTAEPGCGWCPSSYTCMSGDEVGPMAATVSGRLVCESDRVGIFFRFFTTVASRACLRCDCLNSMVRGSLVLENAEAQRVSRTRVPARLATRRE